MDKFNNEPFFKREIVNKPLFVFKFLVYCCVTTIIVLKLKFIVDFLLWDDATWHETRFMASVIVSVALSMILVLVKNNIFRGVPLPFYFVFIFHTWFWAFAITLVFALDDDSWNKLV